MIITPLPQPRPDFRECVTSMIIQGLLVFFAWRSWRGGHQLKISLWFFCFQNTFFSKTSCWLVINRKKSSKNVLLWIFLEIKKIILRYAEMNRLLVGSSLIPLNIELKQDDCTVCCNHEIVTALHCAERSGAPWHAWCCNDGPDFP